MAERTYGPDGLTLDTIEATAEEGSECGVANACEILDLVSRIRELEAGLKKYGVHPPGCQIGDAPAGYKPTFCQCTCGLAELMGGGQ